MTAKALHAPQPHLVSVWAKVVQEWSAESECVYNLFSLKSNVLQGFLRVADEQVLKRDSVCLTREQTFRPWYLWMFVSCTFKYQLGGVYHINTD